MEILDQWETEANCEVEATLKGLGGITLSAHERILSLIAVVRKQRHALCVFHNWMNDRTINKPDDEVVKLSREHMEAEFRIVTEAERILNGK